MKIDSDRARDADRASPSAATLAAQTSANQPAVLSFTAALHKHRQSTTPRAKESADSNDTSSRRTARPGRETSRSDENRRAAANTTESDTSLAAALSALDTAPPRQPAPMLTLLFGAAGAGAGAAAGESSSQANAAAVSAPHLQRLRRVRDAFGAGALPCIEFSHSETGTRFRLSRENDVWLLSIQSPLSSSEAEVQSLIEGLRSHFNASGLGALDVICVD